MDPSASGYPGGPSASLTIHIPLAGGLRKFLLNLPWSYNHHRPSPVIIAFHGKGQDGSQFERETQLTDRKFNTEGALVVFPEGIDKQWTGDPEAPPKQELDDIAFAQALLEYVTTHYYVDLSRIYIVGFSNGGGLTNLLACHRPFSANVAAVAIVSGAIYKDKSLKGDEPLFDVCEPARSPLPVLEMHGSKDPVIHYDGKTTPDGETYSLSEILADWKMRNGAGTEGRERVEVLHGGSVKKYIWWNANKVEAVVHYLIEGFGHGWPSTQRQDDDFQRYGPLDWDGTHDILDFLFRHKIPISHDGEAKCEG